MNRTMFESLKGKKLYRSPRDGIIFGICSGLAHYLDVDVIFVRLVVIVLTVLTHWWLPVAYVIAVFLVPLDPAQDTVARTQSPEDVTDKMDASQNM